MEAYKAERWRWQLKQVHQSLKRSDGYVLEVAIISSQSLKPEVPLSTVSDPSEACQMAGPSSTESIFFVPAEEGDSGMRRLKEEIWELKERSSDYMREKKVEDTF